MVDDDLTGPECRVRDAIKNGDRVDFRDPEHPELEGVASGATWGPERSLRAGVLIELVTTECRPPEQQPRALRFAGAKIIDALDLEGLMLFVLWCSRHASSRRPARTDRERAPLQAADPRDALVARDLDGRVEDLRLEWNGEELDEVLQQGGRALNVEFADALRREIIADGFGNVGLVQRLAEHVCLAEGILETGRNRRIEAGDSLTEARSHVADDMHQRCRGFADNFVRGMKLGRGCMRIAVMGSGGFGGYFGALLARGGADVTFIARGAHLEAMQREGLGVEGGPAPFHLQQVQATGDPQEVGQVDLVMMCVKLWDTEAALTLIRPLVGPETALVSFQNGVLKDSYLRAEYDEAHVIGGVGYVATTISRPG